MWLLSCDGDLWNGRRIWLRPGSTHLLGRTSGRPENGERIQFIDHKSVSRKHLIIYVSPVDPADSSRLHKRTAVSVEDGSKVGSTVNGETLIKETKKLEGKDYTIKLGRYEPLFRLVWQPVTLTCTNLGKKSKADPLAAQKQQLEGSDIKLVTEYVSNETTHVVCKKRNTAVALQALVQARWLVTYEWLNALAGVAQRQGKDANGEPNNCLLETDFDAHWPKEEECVPPTGTEPQPRPDKLFKPNLERAEVFQDFIFVFLSQAQYDSLLPVITSGGGKALLREVDIGEGGAEELVDYVREVAGKKGNKNFRLSQHTGGGGVVLVRLSERDESTRAFLQGVEHALDQRSIEQGEFLDPIVTMDTSALRRQLPESQSEANGSIREPASPPHSAPVREQPAPRAQEEDAPAEQAPSSGQPELDEQPSEQPTAAVKRRRRVIQQSRYTGFDDFDPSQYTKRASPSPEPSAPSLREPSQAPSVQSMDVDEPSQPARTQRTQQSTRKRPAPVPEEPEEDMYESMFPGQAALKRRKTEAVRNGDGSSFAKSAVDADRAATEKGKKVKQKKEKQIDVKAELKARREREEEERRKDAESLANQMDGVEISELKNLAKIEEWDVPFRERPSRGADASGQGERWDPAWNGRKNFKNFRPQGQRRDVPRLQRVIVTLEEVPRKGHGIGEEYWLNPPAKGKAKNSQSQSQTVRAGPSSDDTGDAARFRRRLQHSREEDAEEAADQSVDPIEIAGHARDPGLEALAHGSPSQTLGTESQRKAAGKRPAAKQGGPAAKKARQTTLRNTQVVDLDEEDDDDDGLKFKRRRR